MTYSLTLTVNDIKSKEEFDQTKVAVLTSESEIPKQLGKNKARIHVVNTNKEGFRHRF